VRDILRRTSGPGWVLGGLAGGLSAAAGSGLLVLLAIRPDPVLGAAPAALSWIALGLALTDQLVRRHAYFARYERVGI
jgi:hypothetical protein